MKLAEGQNPAQVRESHEGWLVVARVACVGTVLLAIVLFAAGLPTRYAEFRSLSDSDAGERAAVRADLAQLGLSVDFYAACLLALAITLAVVCFALAALIFLRRPSEPMALFMAAALALLGATFSGAIKALGSLHPVFGWMSSILDSLSLGSVILFFYLFPDGRFVPSWARWLALLFAAHLVPTTFLPGTAFTPDNWPDSIYVAVLLSWLSSGVLAQAYRYRRVSSPTERQQTKWVVFGFATAIAGYLGLLILGVIFPSLGSNTVSVLAGATAATLFMLVIPFSTAIAILRYRLWDIDVLINRTLTYGALSTIVVGLYVLVVGYLGALFPSDNDAVISLLATGLVAVLFAPLRNRLQRGVNHLMYGERDDPYKVLAGLGESLENTLAPNAVLPTITEAVATALKFPYVAIALKRGGEGVVKAAEYGKARVPEELLSVPLTYQKETVAELLLAPRAPGEAFSKSDLRLLEDLSRQIGVAAYAVRLTAELQHSRERLVMAREEERRRLRRDLHDGVGPQLAALMLELETASELVSNAPEASALIAKLSERTRETVSDVRRSVHALRPPSLDELGLVGALREGATQYDRGGLHVLVEAPEELQYLPAAVEVACYRIAQEAMTNVVRHAGATTCWVRIALDEEAGALSVTVEDDGRGIRENDRAGVGMSSMRERAEELGGRCTVLPSAKGGTLVSALLPCRAAGEATDRREE